MSLCFTFSDGVLAAIIALLAMVSAVVAAVVASILLVAIALFNHGPSGLVAAQLIADALAAWDTIARCARSPVCQSMLCIYSVFSVMKSLTHKVRGMQAAAVFSSLLFSFSLSLPPSR